MSVINTAREFALAVICAVVFSFAFAGCGKKGPPKPPELHPTNNAAEGATQTKQ